MSAFRDLASPAPRVEAATADEVDTSGSLTVEAATPSGSVRVEPAPRVEPAALYDDPKKFAPPIPRAEASHLSVASLRGSGADFEGEAAVIKGPVQKNFFKRALPFLFDERDFVSYGEVARFVFVKGNCIFVYGQETDTSPLYLIEMQEVTVVQEDPRKPDKNSYTVSPRVNTNEGRESLVTLLLKDRVKGKLAYQISFDTSKDKGMAKRFLDVVSVNSKRYGSEVVTASVVTKK
mmetsp:Transcript_127774/g.190414  ORF Transcript_127774/g.190414 Transcript_127774/m.190414 type:complete len:235 (+) Transcript_127774:113-817(+)|eukprot:CAMPEP_0116998888 /NCGR_PEP_ID=MMETSP0472-20121206/1805_1 /TAXON_ID=693140 ORGANISM="Tiarina fusus, Strain LIS" /NCGR_SAMPLE_ID=MMETSP0472 /ASSEMBLY_ACC=CAM_ASM_000603 /LENGTH=234 /DNA_ID=CAMNT_0004698181 /DNA_START=112 /DNA_END=816 /DNA_ORIENTATION=+